jgi:hypothetical protein
MCTTRLTLLGLLQNTELGLGLRFTLYLLSKMEARIGTKKAVTHRKKGHKNSFTQGSVPGSIPNPDHLSSLAIHIYKLCKFNPLSVVL